MKSAELRSILARGSKSFSLASYLLPAERRDDAAAVYAFCRRCDDAIDEAPRHHHRAALTRLRDELDAVYAGKALDDIALAAFQEVTRKRRLPREYPDDLIEGMVMDVEGRRYRDLGELSLYCYRVAGTVGLMMCHVLGVKNDAALEPAVHLGIALQMTNIARDVAEDWKRGRLYLPDSHLGADVAESLHQALGGPLPEDRVDALAGATMRLLREADDYYRSADKGLRWLSLRDAAAMRCARWIYWGIGERVAARGGDPRQERAVVPLGDKLRLMRQALTVELYDMPARVRAGLPTHIPRAVFRFGAEKQRVHTEAAEGAR